MKYKSIKQVKCECPSGIHDSIILKQVEDNKKGMRQWWVSYKYFIPPGEHKGNGYLSYMDNVFYSSKILPALIAASKYNGKCHYCDDELGIVFATDKPIPTIINAISEFNKEADQIMSFMRQNIPTKEETNYALVSVNLKIYVKDIEDDATDDDILKEAFESMTSNYAYCKRYMSIEYIDTETDYSEVEVETED